MGAKVFLKRIIALSYYYDSESSGGASKEKFKWTCSCFEWKR